MPIPSTVVPVLRPLLSLAAALALGCTMQAGPPTPSPWARNYPDTTAVTSGRVVRFAANYGLTGPSPAVLFHEVNGQVSGQMLVWYPRFEPADAKGATPADSAARWKTMQAGMSAARARLDSTYACRAWSKGRQEGPAWICRVPERTPAPDWAAELARLDSLVAARASLGPPPGRRPDPVAPPPPSSGGVARLPPGSRVCMDGGSWNIQIRDPRGTKVVTAPPPSGGCPQPDGPAKRYDQAGWQMLKEFIAAVVQ